MTFDQAVARTRAEHQVSISWGAWSCSCGAESVVSPNARTERQALAAADRHLRAATLRNLAEQADGGGV